MRVYCKFCGAKFHSPSKEYLECTSCGNTDDDDFEFGPDDPIQTDNPLIAKWIEIGRKNPWIAAAWDPEFDENSFHKCETFVELIKELEHGNWSTGQGFYYKNMAFINQVNGGDEWLVIRDDIKFESWSCGSVIRRSGPDRFATQFYQMYHATDEQLKYLNYNEVEVPETFEFDGIEFNYVGREW
jgi:hypothetical protein